MPDNEYHERIFTEDIEEMVYKIIKGFNRPYPEDITDKVFLTIENTPEYLRQYLLFASVSDGANSMIGKMVREITGLRGKGPCKNPESTLISTYTKLGY
jgi:hypothetical protein